MRKYNYYTREEKKQHIEAFWKRKDKDPSFSIRRYANENGIHYYSFRDWYRSSEYNPRWEERYKGLVPTSMMSMPVKTELDLVLIGGNSNVL